MSDFLTTKGFDEHQSCKFTFESFKCKCVCHWNIKMLCNFITFHLSLKYLVFIMIILIAICGLIIFQHYCCHLKPVSRLNSMHCYMKLSPIQLYYGNQLKRSRHKLVLKPPTSHKCVPKVMQVKSLQFKMLRARRNGCPIARGQ